MSLYCVVDDDDLGQVATVQGWSDFIKWANRQGYFNMAHLSQHGYVTDLATLADELHWAIKNSKPREDVEATARGIEEIARTYPHADILIVTDGDGDNEDDDEDDSNYPGADNLDDFPDDEEPQPAKKATKRNAKKTPVNKKGLKAPPAKKATKKKR